MATDLRAIGRRLLARLREQPIATAEAFRNFIQERAALVAQKCAIDYCRGKTGLASYALFTEKPFLEALDVCRWETFAAVLEDLILLAEGQLRAHVPAERQARLAAALLGLHSAVLAAWPPPAHRPGGWNDAIERFAARLRSASAAQPRPALQLADHSAKRLFDTLPIHLSMRKLDEEVVYGAVRFRMVAISQEMRRRLSAADLAASLTA
jgi:hypothetical protein